MTEDQLFEGFDPERQKAYERELVEDWGVEQDEIDRSTGAVQAMGPEGIAANEAQRAEIEAALVALMTAGAAPDDERVLDVLVGHWELTGRYWGRAPSAEAYAGLGSMYVEHPEFKARYDAMAPGFARVDQRRGHGLRPGPPHLTPRLPRPDQVDQGRIVVRRSRSRTNRRSASTRTSDSSLRGLVKESRLQGL